MIHDALEESGQFEDTIIIYTSDHGDMMGKFDMWWKCSLYEDSIRIPLIVAGPGFAEAERVNTPVSLLDLQVSIFKSLDKVYPENWWGEPLQTIKKNDKSRVVFAEYHGHVFRGSAYMIRKGKWKLIYNAKAENQLYNLENDPDELNNIIEKRPEIYDELKQELLNFCSPEIESKKAEDFIEKQLRMIR